MIEWSIMHIITGNYYARLHNYFWIRHSSWNDCINVVWTRFKEMVLIYKDLG